MTTIWQQLTLSNSKPDHKKIYLIFFSFFWVYCLFSLSLITHYYIHYCYSNHILITIIIQLSTIFFPFIYLIGCHDNTVLERAKTTEPSGYITKLFDDTGVENAIQMVFIIVDLS
jgi:hypothetical protein